MKLATPKDNSTPQLLGVGLWNDFAGMMEHYADAAHRNKFGGAFSGLPQSSIWEQPRGHWSEW